MKNKAHYVFLWSLCMVVITLPFPKYSLNSQSLILLFFSWLAIGDWNQKWFYLKQMKLPLILMTSTFWLSLLGLLYTEDLSNGLDVLLKNLPFLILPVIIFSSLRDSAILKKVLSIFSIAVVIACGFAIFKATIFKIKNLGDFFYYIEFSKILDVHTTYFALFIILSLLYFINTLSKNKKDKIGANISCVVVLLVTLYLVSSRISVLALSILLIILFIDLYRQKVLDFKKSLIAVLLILFCGFLMVSPNFQNRSSGRANFGNELPEVSSRKLHWIGVFYTIRENNILFGNGTGDAYDGLYENYRKVKFDQGDRLKYNAHNQFLEIMLYFGLLGLIALLGVFFIGFKKSVKNKDIIGVSVLIIFFIFMMTESLLVRQNGIMLFNLLLSFVFIGFNNKMKTEKHQ